MLLGSHIGMLGWRGTTIGGAIMGIKCYRMNGISLDYEAALVQGFSAMLSFLVLGLGFFWRALGLGKSILARQDRWNHRGSDASSYFLAIVATVQVNREP